MSTVVQATPPVPVEVEVELTAEPVPTLSPPIKKQDTTLSRNPEQDASCLSKLFFSYLSSLLKLGSTRPLTPQDIPPPLDTDAAEVCYDRFENFWKEEDLATLKNTPQHRRGVKAIGRVACRFVGAPALRSSLYYAMYVVLTFAPPFLLKALVGHLEGSVVYSTTVLWLLVAGTLVIPPFNSLVLSQHNAIMSRAGVQLRTVRSTTILGLWTTTTAVCTVVCCFGHLLVVEKGKLPVANFLANFQLQLPDNFLTPSS